MNSYLRHFSLYKTAAHSKRAFFGPMFMGTGADLLGGAIGYATTDRDNAAERAKKDFNFVNAFFIPGATGYQLGQKLTAKHLLEQMRKEQLQQAGSQESPQAAAKVAALQHFGLYRVKTAFTLLANKTPRWRADNEAEILRDNTEREYDQSHRLEQVGRYLARTGTLLGSINAGVRAYEGRPLRDAVPSIVFSTLSGALDGGLRGQRDKQVAELAKPKIEGLGITDPLERRMLEQRLRPGIAGDPVGGAVLGGLVGLGLSGLAKMRGGRTGAHEREAARAAARAQDQQAWDDSHGDNTPGY